MSDARHSQHNFFCLNLLMAVGTITHRSHVEPHWICIHKGLFLNGKTQKKTWIWLISETPFKYIGDNYYYVWDREKRNFYIYFLILISNSFRRMNFLRHSIWIWYYCYWLLKYFSFWLLFNDVFLLSPDVLLWMSSKLIQIECYMRQEIDFGILLSWHLFDLQRKLYV